MGLKNVRMRVRVKASESAGECEGWRENECDNTNTYEYKKIHMNTRIQASVKLIRAERQTGQEGMSPFTYYFTC